MKKKIIPIILILLIVLVNFISPSKIEAKTLGEFKSELNSLKTQYSNNESKKKLTEDQIVAIEKRIDSINAQTEKLNKEIKSLNSEIEVSKAESKKMDEEMKNIINLYQKNTSNPFYLEYLLDGKDYTEFIYRLAVVEQLTDYSKKMIDKYNAIIKKNNDRLKEIDKKKEEIKNLEKELIENSKKLQDDLTGIKIAGMDLTEDIKKLEQTVKTYEETYKCSENEQITTCVNRYYSKKNGNKVSTNVASSAGFYYPIGYWTNMFPYGHHDRGLDLSVSEGQPVHPIADGTVTEITPKYRCGGNMIYIVHNVKGKKYTSAYFHLKSYNVRVGQEVSHNDIIGFSGGARIGKSTNSYDYCTTGPHLHLQVATGYYDPHSYFGGYIGWGTFNSRSFNPATILNF